MPLFWNYLTKCFCFWNLILTKLSYRWNSTLAISSSMHILSLKFFFENLSGTRQYVEFHLKIYIELDFENIEFYTKPDFVKIELKKKGYFAK